MNELRYKDLLPFIGDYAMYLYVTDGDHNNGGGIL
jgi:hypothetical protein